MTTFLTLIKKETLHIVRDKRTVLIALFMPLVLLLLFGFAISTEVNDVRVVAVVDNHTDDTRNIIARLSANDYFTFLGIVNHNEVESILRRGDADAAIYFSTDAGILKSQIVVDASNTVVAQASAAYVQNVIAGTGASNGISSYTLYNPQLKSAYNFVPGIMGMIFILICAIMTSVSIVREKETGTMNLLLVSPLKPSMIIVCKLVPYFVLSCVILAIMLTMAYTVLGLPTTGVLSVVITSLIYIIMSLSIGLLVSSIVKKQITAMIVSAVAFMLPVIMLSGMIFPVDNMPTVLQWISGIIPARWYIEAMRKLMIQQLGLECVLKELAILTSLTVVILAIAIKKFNVTK
ncbi:MAG: ABC transporter permease [Candidatus Limisoma sp.]